ncbi:kazrin-A isoform X2 [Pangasianodon hypophthalmus]|uniref:kazrin-A isoform X2 n=1 Tax=Pangasianodon hypophthalmus TaxID=310915 RepID=UPI000EFFB352|nr:kazrin-A isoform X2 [Pangasianodon hypophthalmus]
MEDGEQLARRGDATIGRASQEPTELRADPVARDETGEAGARDTATVERRQARSCHDAVRQRGTEVSNLTNLSTHDTTLDKVLLREEVLALQEEVAELKRMKEMLNKELEECGGGCSAELLSAAELRVQLSHRERDLDRASEALQAMKADRKRLKMEKAELVNQMQQLYATLESREEQLRDFIRNYEQHRKESEDAVKVLAKEKDLLEREKWDLRRQTKEATELAVALRSAQELKENRIKELEAELAMAKQSLATLTKDVPKRHSLAMPTEAVVNGNQEWVMHAEMPLTAAIRQSQHSLYHTLDRHVLKAVPQCVCDVDGVCVAHASGSLRLSPCHSRQPSMMSDASVLEGERSSTPSDLNSPRHRTHSLCNSLEDLEDQKRRKKKEKMGLSSLSRVFARGKQRKSLDPGLFDDSDSLSSPGRLSANLSDGEEQLDKLQQVELARAVPMSRWRAGTVQAWLEVIMAMPMYIRACADNVKSGKVMLALTDTDLEAGLGISNSMHRRKLRLAIEDYRQAESGHGLSNAADLDHHWVAQAWLSDVGLPQYSQFFHTHLVDGRLLSTLTRADLEKHLHVSKKAHQSSLLLGIQLLHMLNFNKELLQARRADCENRNSDLLVWSCQRIIKWLRDIDLKEFAGSLQNSGIHGAVMVLDPSFNTDSMATALGISASKHMVRQHLSEEMKALLAAARLDVEQEVETMGTPPTISRQSSLGRSMISHHDGQYSFRQLKVRPEVSFNLKSHGGVNSTSLNASCEDATPQPENSPARNVSAADLTNV